jgi:hypothetical protein
MTLRVSISGKGLLWKYYCTVNTMLPPPGQDGEYRPLSCPEKSFTVLYLISVIHISIHENKALIHSIQYIYTQFTKVWHPT